MAKRVDWIPDVIPSMDCLNVPFTDAFGDDASTPVERLVQHHTQMFRNVSPTLRLDVASEARLIGDMAAKPDWVYRFRRATGTTARLKLAALASLILLCLICAGCPDESQQQSSSGTSRSAHPSSVAVAENSSASIDLVCAGVAILAAFLCKRKDAGD